MADPAVSIILGGLGAVIITAAASGTSAFISSQIKISEFRQAWINELRKDIADYTGAAEKWFQKYDELNTRKPDDHNEWVRRTREDLMPLANEATVFLRRIQMRINPRDNPNKAEDETLLQSLADLIDPAKLDPRHLTSSWEGLARDAVERPREVLKREWEVTKRAWSKRLWAHD
jgi:hypothetical protein